MLLFLVYLESLCSVRNCSESGEYCYFLNFLELDGRFVFFFFLHDWSLQAWVLVGAVCPAPLPSRISRIWWGLDHALLGNQAIVLKSVLEASFRILWLPWDFILVSCMVNLMLVLLYLCKFFVIIEHARSTNAFCQACGIPTWRHCQRKSELSVNVFKQTSC